MSNLAETKNYSRAVEVHKQIIQTANFSQISAFIGGFWPLFRRDFPDLFVQTFGPKFEIFLAKNSPSLMPGLKVLLQIAFSLKI